MNRQLQQDGFTLYELLASICIVLLLIALIIPAWIKVKQTTGNVQCVSNLRQIGIGFIGYINEYGYGPPHWGPSFFDPNSGSNFLWTGHLAPYLGIAGDVNQAKLPNIFDCPQDPDSKSRPRNRGFISTADNWAISYGFNYPWLTSQKGWWRGVTNLRAISNPTTLVLAADSLPLSKGGTLIALIDPSTWLNHSDRGMDFRHGEKANAVFLDGHVQVLGVESQSDPKYWQPLR